MTPVPPGRRRLPILGCAALALAAVALPACGSGDSATAERTAEPPAHKAPPARRAAGAACPEPVQALVGALDSMRRQLAVGLSYEQYAAKVGGLRRDYGEVPVERLTIGCLTTAATPAEKALNQYIGAVNAWGECLADAACTTAAIEPVLQRRWRRASHLIPDSA